MLLIGHRGCKYPGYNQNTIRAFAKVAAEGVPAIEFDVQRTADGHLVVVHNLDLEEVSTGKGEVVHTDSAIIRELYAGDPAKGKDRIPFLTEVFDFFASLPPGKRPAIHLELKGRDTGRAAGELFMRYVTAGRLSNDDLLVSSFNWQELNALRESCRQAQIALLDGAIRRDLLLQKVGREAEIIFNQIFAYGNEDYMLPRFASVPENLALLHSVCDSEPLRHMLLQEIEECLAGHYYNQELLDTACAMQASSVNLWYRTVTASFIEKAHNRGLQVMVYTVNDPQDLTAMAQIGVDGIFTDYYTEALRHLAAPSRTA